MTTRPPKGGALRGQIYLSAKHNLEVLGRAVAAERLNVEEMEA
jgi:hypothetical protein